MAEYTLVIAGNYRQFKEWCYQNNRHPMDRFIRNIHSPEQMRGYDPNDVEFAFVGTYMDRKDIWAIMREIDIIKAKRGNNG